MKKRFSDEQIISILRGAEAGISTRELCCKRATSDATLCIYGLPQFGKYRIWFWVVAYIYPTSGKSVPKWVICSQSPQ
jgi:putative transposase